MPSRALINVLHDFYKICSIYSSFEAAFDVKIWMDLLKGYGVMRILS